MSSPEGRKGILKLSERLVNSYLFGITSLKTGKWSTVQGNFGTDVVLKTRRVTDDPGLPNGILLGVDTSFMLSLAPSIVFEFLRDHKFRKEVCIQLLIKHRVNILFINCSKFLERICITNLV